MNGFIRVSQNVTRICIAFKHHQCTGVTVNWLQSYTFQIRGNVRLLCRNVTNTEICDYKAVVTFSEKPIFYHHSITSSWFNMKTKQPKSRGDISGSSKNRKHKHKKDHKRKKNKEKSKVKLSSIMAAAESVLNEDSCSDDEVLIVYDAQKHSRESKNRKVEEIVLDDEDTCENSSVKCLSLSDISLLDIPLPPEKRDVLDLDLIPLPCEGPCVPNGIQQQSTSCQNGTSLRQLSESENIVQKCEREQIIADYIVADNPTLNIYDYESEVRAANACMQNIRQWENTRYGHALELSGGASQEGTIFSVMSYNVLAQKLLESHRNLYSSHDVRALTWEHRKRTLLNEFRAANADVLCLQEIQYDHLEWYNEKLSELGYKGIFKRRTNDHVDGCAIYFKEDRFRLVEKCTVEYYQPGVSVLDRDNVGLIARLKIIGSEDQLVVATTHLLFNPRRHDVKLAQMQLLLTELERISYLRFDEELHKPVYRPIIITGDFNLQPDSAVYRFVTDGFLDYSVLSARTLKPHNGVYGLQNSLLPPYLQVSNTCQHLGIVQHRQTWRHDTEEGLIDELRLLKPYNSENYAFLKKHDPSSNFRSLEEYVRKAKDSGCFQNFMPNFYRRLEPGASSDTIDLDIQGMEPGMLSHSFHLRSVYKHTVRDPYSSQSLREATTHQQSWVTVDYIFYSGQWNHSRQATVEGQLKLLSRFRLPTEDQCREQLKHIPNMSCGSDHLPLLARFLLRS